MDDQGQKKQFEEGEEQNPQAIQGYEQLQEEKNEELQNEEMQNQNAKPQVAISYQPTQQQAVSQPGFLRRLITCRCSRGQEIQSEQQNEVLAGDVKSKPAQKNADDQAQTRISCKERLDTILKKITPWYALLLYYLVFAAAGAFAIYLWIRGERIFLQILAGTFIAAQSIKFIWALLIQDEWQDELPYIDSENFNNLRIIGIYLCHLLNIDINYWLYLIYRLNKRDMVIEHMYAISRFIDVILWNIPQLLISAYVQLSDTQDLQLPCAVVFGLNLLTIVNSMMHLNFFDGSAFLSIYWSVVYIAELYLRTLIVVSAYIMLQNYEIQYPLLGFLLFIGFLQLILLSENEGFFNTCFKFIYYSLKTILVLKFREISFGMEQLDCGAQSAILKTRKNVSQLVFSLIQLSINFVVTTNLLFLLMLLGAWDIIKEGGVLLWAYEGGIACYGIQILYCLNVFQQSVLKKGYFKVD